MNQNAGDRPKLVLLTGKQKGTDLVLNADSMVVGRTEEADLVIRDKSISRRHASFSRSAGGWVVSDLESKNGIRVNNRQANEQGLRTGDVVTIGNVKMKFVDPMELGSAPSVSPPESLPPAPTRFAPLPQAQPGFPPLPQAQPGFPPLPGQQGFAQPPAPAYDPAQAQPGFPHPPGQPGYGPFPGYPPLDRVQPQPASDPSPQGMQVPAPVQDGGVYVPQPNVRPDLYAPPPEFYAPPAPVKHRASGDTPLTRRKMIIYLTVFGTVGALLGYLLYVTFGPKYEPFSEAAKLAVREIRLVDMDKYWSDIRGASWKVETPRVASASYDSGLGILKVEGRALGNTDVVFLDAEGRILGRVGIHVLEGERQKRFVDRAAMTEEQLVARARDLMVEGDALAKAHIAQAILKYGMACELLEWVTDESVKAIAKLKLSDMVEEREKRFRKLRDRYVQANKLGDLPAAKDLLSEICDIYPDLGDERHQQAKIFLKRIERRQAAQKRS